MTMTITVPENLEVQLQQQAKAQHRSAEDVAVGILRDALEGMTVFPSIDDVVATIKGARPNPQGIRPARGSLADALRSAPSDPEFDLARWNQDWAAVESEMRAMTRADDVAEGRT